MAVEGHCGADHAEALPEVSCSVQANRRPLARFIADSIAVRSGGSQIRANRQLQDAFRKEFETNYAAPLTSTHINIINRKKTQFVGNKTLNTSLRFLTKALNNKTLYKSVCQPHLQSILYEITLPLLLISEKDVQTWTDN